MAGGSVRGELTPDFAGHWLACVATDRAAISGWSHEFDDDPRNKPYRTIFQQGDTCQTVVMIRPEERTLPNIVLGSLPAGANYIDVRVQLSRTVSPSTYLDDPVPALIPNAQVFLPGGSCIVEATPIWRRLFEIVISGSQIILRRRQSVSEIPVAFPNSEGWRRYAGIYRNNNGDRQEGSSNTWSGWGNNASTGHQAGHPAALIQSKPFGYNPGHSAPSNQAKARGRGNACSMSHNHNYASTYSGQIIIRPGYIAS